MWSAILLISVVMLGVLYYILYYALFVAIFIRVTLRAPVVKKKLLTFLDENCAKRDKEYDEIMEYANSLNNGFALKKIEN